MASWRVGITAAIMVALSGCSASVSRPAAIAPATLAAAAEPAMTILISVDGLRPDYLTRGVTPNLNRLAASGVTAAMRPSFPSLTFPNHYALVTGLRPDRNGIVDNRMVDARRPGVQFTLGDARQALDPFWWDAAEPIWITAEKQGVRTATMFWPGSEVPFGTTRPADWLRYDKAVGNVQRVNTVLDWARRPIAIRPRFVTLYFDTVDTAGHGFGPDAPETTASVAEIDTRIGDLVKGLADIGRQANLVIVADHGMLATSEERIVRIDQIVDPAAVEVVATGATAAINPLPGQEAMVAAALLKPHPHMQCQAKADLPERLHYGQNPRVPAIICLAEAGWLINAGPLDERGAPKGMHGYDNALPEMRAAFIASGPAIASRSVPDDFQNVDVYRLLARLIAVTPLPDVDGDPKLADAIVIAK